LYYTVFGLESLRALQQPIPDSVRAYLQKFGDGSTLDFVHRCCLARCWAIVDSAGFAEREGLAAHILANRSRDGGFAQRCGEAQGNAYALYLAISALQDIAVPLPAVSELLTSLAGCRAADGGYGNHPKSATGTTPTTVSAVLVLHALGQPVDKSIIDWLKASRWPQGGFRANHQAPMPDLLSTATALHALACVQSAPNASQVEADLDYIDTLWTNSGAFHGHWAEDDVDVEYTYYGLLALGHLSLPT
jgi:prenyltransferase beta subunit